jgi:hypothetical protein
MSTKQPYLVINQEPRFSKVYGTPMTKITLLGIKDRKEYVTYIDTPNRNHANWHHITNNPDHGFILRGLRIKTFKGKTLIDADSQPIVEWEDDNQEEMLKQIQELWEEEDRKNNTDKFSDLFSKD